MKIFPEIQLMCQRDITIDEKMFVVGLVLKAEALHGGINKLSRQMGVGKIVLEEAKKFHLIDKQWLLLYLQLYDEVKTWDDMEEQAFEEKIIDLKQKHNRSTLKILVDQND